MLASIGTKVTGSQNIREPMLKGTSGNSPGKTIGYLRLHGFIGNLMSLLLRTSSIGDLASVTGESPINANHPGENSVRLEPPL